LGYELIIKLHFGFSIMIQGGGGGGVYILPIGHVVCQHFRFSSAAHSELIHGDASARWIERCIDLFYH
jgi:hypothetical protein